MGQWRHCKSRKIILFYIGMGVKSSIGKRIFRAVENSTSS
jgi:hypothetical protein